MAGPRVETDPAAMRRLVRRARAKGKSIGFVPTMGAFHGGHLSLLRQARKENDFLAVSIFVNPTQFGPGEDLSTYPRQEEKDLEFCRAEKVNAVFTPKAEDMYPEGHVAFVEPGPTAQHLEGMSRPGHFRGVTTVVAKLFNIALPDRAYFGQKDAQQIAVIRRMVRDLDFGVEIVVGPTVREADGLALSSRNAGLKPRERQAALCLARALEKGRELAAAGAQRATEVAAAMAEEVVAEPLCELDYAAVVNPETFEDVTSLDRPALAALAVVIGKTRLIDNVMLKPPGGAKKKTGKAKRR